MPIPRSPLSDFVESFDFVNLGLETYKDYNLLGQDDYHQINLCPDKLKKLNIYARAYYQIYTFEAGTRQYYKRPAQCYPYDFSTYEKQLREELKSFLSAYSPKQRLSGQKIDDFISHKIEEKRRASFYLKDLIFNQKYVDDCITRGKERFYFGFQASLSTLLVQGNHWDNKKLSSQFQENGFRNISYTEEKIKKLVYSFEPQRLYHLIIPCYEMREDIDDFHTRKFFDRHKDLLEQYGDFFLNQDAYYNLIYSIAKLAFLWREAHEVDKKFIEKANEFIDFRKSSKYHLGIELINIFFEDLISDIEKKDKAIRCLNCGLLSTYFRTKKFCSERCLKRFHSREDYYRNREKRLSKRRNWIQKTRREIPNY